MNQKAAQLHMLDVHKHAHTWGIRYYVCLLGREREDVSKMCNQENFLDLLGFGIFTSKNNLCYINDYAWDPDLDWCQIV